LPNDTLPLTDPEEIRDRLERHVDLIIDGGACGIDPTSVLDLSGGDVTVVRKGKGDVSQFGA
jgi:tRNA A37 threonylcarbamoyladenosine synthetase subunit TsaC/SUA5/YrdC